MNTLIVYPENEEQLFALKIIIKAMKISFEHKVEAYPQHVINGVNESVKQANEGFLTPFTGTKDMLIL
ncbi:MAG: hypothetical protein EOP43_05595 [Sphingobacteriaceae bacterium]|nr:MAG: hypothetical protein EOP43_05595 [Sphingobacteriaceae bacterium]